MAVVIAEKSDVFARRKTKSSRSGRPLSFDAKDIKNRNAVERAGHTLKNGRGTPTRDDTYALVYRGGTVLSSIVIWLS